MSLDHDKLTGFFSTQQFWYLQQAEGLPGLQPDLDLFKLRRVSNFVINSLLNDVSPRTPIFTHSYSQHHAVKIEDSPYEHYLNQGTLCSLNVNPFWNIQVELHTPRVTDREAEPIEDPGTVRAVDIEWWPQENEEQEGEMQEYFPNNPISFSRRNGVDSWEPASEGNQIPLSEQLDVLLLIAHIKQFKPPYAKEG